MSDHLQATRQEARKPRLKPLSDFLSENSITASDYIREVFGGESAMPPPIVTPTAVYIERGMEARWRDRMVSTSLLRLCKLAGGGGLRHGRR